MKMNPDRARASLVIAAYADRMGWYWTGLADAVADVAGTLGVDQDGRTRSAIAIECAAILESRGVVIPDGYVPPWHRAVYVSGMPAIQRGGRRDRTRHDVRSCIHE